LVSAFSEVFHASAEGVGSRPHIFAGNGGVHDGGGVDPRFEQPFTGVQRFGDLADLDRDNGRGGAATRWPVRRTGAVFDWYFR